MDKVDPEVAPNASVKDEVIDQIVKDGERALNDRRDWERKAREWYSRRYGIRSPKNFPWKGASNLNIPLTDKIMRRIKPTFQNAVFSVNPIATIEPLGEMPKTTATSIERGYDWLVRYRMERSRQEMGYVDDAMLTYGFSLLKTVWEYEAERATRSVRVDWLTPEEEAERDIVPPATVARDIARRFALDEVDDIELIEELTRSFFAGEEELTITLTTEVYDAPRWHYASPMDVIVPWDSSLNIDDFPWIIHRMYLTPSQLEQRIHSGRYDGSKLPAGAELMGRETPATAELDQRQQWREGVQGSEQNAESQIVMWEIYFRHDADGDGVSERYVATVHKASNTVVRVIPFPYEHREWPFTRFDFESNEPRWYATRGIPEMIHDLQVEINSQHNAKTDNMAIGNSKAFVYRKGSIRNAGNWKFRPGAMFPVARGPDDVREIPHQSMDFSFNAEEENLRAWAEEYIGTPDFGISNINQRVERRTATEVQQIQQSTGAVAELTLRRYQESMRRVHRQTLFLWAQYGDPTVLVRVAGGEPITFIRYDIYRDFDLVPTGDTNNLTPQARLARATALTNLAESQVFGPYVRPFEIAREVVENLDFRNAERYLIEPGIERTDAADQQIDEIAAMRIYLQPEPVDQRDNHQEHLQVLQAALTNMTGDDPAAAALTAHFAIHASFVGEQGPLNQMLDAGLQVQQVGTKIVARLPAEPQGQPQQAQQAQQPQDQGQGQPVPQ